MTVPPEENHPSDTPRAPDPAAPAPAADPAAPLDFDPYRFGKPDHPVPPEYAPPGYTPPGYPPPANTPGAQAPGQQPEPPLDFDPYRFGRPDGPVPPQYAPPGHRPEPGLTPPQFSYPPPPPRGAPYGAPRVGNTKATVSLVLGVVAIVLSFLSIWDLLLAVPAIVLGATARADARKYPERGGLGTATSGLICGIVAIALAIAATVYIYAKIKPCIDEYGSSGKQFQTCSTDRLLGD